MKELLRETYETTKKVSGVDPAKPGHMKEVLTNDDAFDTYVKGLSEDLDQTDQEHFKLLAENTRVNLLENSMYQINPYESLVLPVLRVFYPKLIAKEAITVSPMDKPESVKSFLKANFQPSQSNSWYEAPATGTDISGSPSIGTKTSVTIGVPSEGYDLLSEIGASSDEAHIERGDFKITEVSHDGTNYTAIHPIVPAVEGHFSGSVSTAGGDDVLTGKVDFLAGTVDIASTSGVVTDVKVEASVSLEENKINPKVQLTVDKIRLYSKDRQITADWTINMEQDMRALFDLSMQAEVVNILGQQIALDIDREIVQSLIASNDRMNPSSHNDSFDRNPPADYNWGPKYWHENILPKLNKLSAQVYNDTNIDSANTILANPLDVSILEDLQGFNYTGTSSVNGDMGYRQATVAGGKWRVLTSSVVNQGKMIMVYKPMEELKSVYMYAPYVPAILHPYPLANKPSLTILSRYATSLIRSAGIATLDING